MQFRLQIQRQTFRMLRFNNRHILRGDFIAGDRVIAKLKKDGLVFEKERLH